MSMWSTITIARLLNDSNCSNQGTIYKENEALIINHFIDLDECHLGVNAESRPAVQAE